MEMLSIRQPGFAMLESLPIRQRRTMLWPAVAAGRLTVVVTKPPAEMPLQAWRPAIGLPKAELIVAL
jgi:hypothetical protein